MPSYHRPNESLFARSRNPSLPSLHSFTRPSEFLVESHQFLCITLRRHVATPSSSDIIIFELV